MSYIVDDTATLTIDVIQPPNPARAEIRNLNYPSSVEPSTPFSLSYDVYNTGGCPATLYGKIYNTDTNSVIPGSSWTANVSCGDYVSKVYQFSGITQPLHLKIEVGHIE